MPENLLKEKSAAQAIEPESGEPFPSGLSPACEPPGSRQSSAAPLSNGVSPADLLLTDVWIVDSGAPMVCQYLGASSRTSGSQSAGASFALTNGNTKPQDVADPPVGVGVPLNPSRSDAGDPNSLSRVFTEPSNVDIDSVFTALAGD
jgi:hypothetical protein